MNPVVGKLYLTFNGWPATWQIRSYGLDGTNLSIVKSLDSGATAFDVELDPVRRELCWNEYGLQRIQKTRQDGSGTVELVCAPPGGFGNGMHFDEVNRQVYFAATMPGRFDVHRVSADGMGETWLVHEPDWVNYIEVLHLEEAGLTIAGQPESQAVFSGQTASLRVTAAGTGPLSYRWYVGQSGDTCTPIAGAVSPTYTPPPPTATTAYWVRVGNAFGSVDSESTTITPRVTLLSDGGFVRSDGAFEFVVLAQPGTALQVQTPDDLATWIDLTNVVSTSGGVTIVDPTAAAHPSRFYRVVSP
ncbi:MAG: hypothetical protein HS113_25360 [Verrucomicrobiales bacterium]|nr:hypothetical protein [Verrucomicrobiales bacterium]